LKLFTVNKLGKQQNGGEIAINSTHSILKMLVGFIGLARPANLLRRAQARRVEAAKIEFKAI